ncbi:MAG: hypothetical protein COX62_08590 [Deltaproteobacteria bacterium CG_4_10_14_0_2_um_filter_43_8]|nr:MAG: hypothetical protein COV43_01295 [Deltaproteobacteria bacterium CG11_big_fil_rev_8_21_14_0_20_42_23]PJA18530.1 MAG: hypothetical protein COX62_08590 [Deltaproteobacteria bacterium CG_4_10_14_0_2_um_filter_43_8]PJC63303.1 MAG: hypothetical protein CO021_10120 [Deltaproteobacteria bacterium CG_4_9_14_0_2_um_filter_42_21]
MKKLTKQQAKAFLSRWQAVAKIEKVQLQKTSFVQKYQQLLTLLSVPHFFSLSSREKETQRTDAQQNWKKLRARLTA